LEPLEKESCDKVQLFVLNFVATILTQFTDKVALAMRQLIIEVDHTLGDTGMYAVEQAHSVAKHYLDTVDGTMGALALTGNPTKDNYYKTVFAMVDELLPAIKGVESIFGDTIAVNGLPCSRIVKAILENA
jgi:hypothetical protein